MSWKEEKERKTNSFKRKQAELERVRMLHDLFFKNKKQPKDKRAPNV